ncbi:MAG: S9 family peptidase [Gammaproteobacteria bacterium]|nr:S9 family peptidase [Gammaproteobacteria bacterium]
MKIGVGDGVKVSPYGSWSSSLSLDHMVEDVVRLAEPAVDGSAVYWIETRPSEKGRSVLVTCAPGQEQSDVTPADYSVRSRAHEYGGGSYLARGDRVWFVNDDDQCIYTQTLPAGSPERLTATGAMRFADMELDRARNRLLTICEDHGKEGNPENFIAGVDLDSGEISAVVSGADFYSNPRLSPDGSRLSWLSWNHPNLPWDTTELWLATVAPDGEISEQRCVSLGKDESVFQPQWSPDGDLFFVSDRSGWWNLFRFRDDATEVVIPEQAECGVPQWVFGMSTYAFPDSDHVVIATTRDGSWQLSRFGLATGRREALASDWTSIEGVAADDGCILILAGGGARALSVVSIDPQGAETVLKSAIDGVLDQSTISKPQAITYATSDGDQAHGFFYPPSNPVYRGPNKEKPPLLMICHGGPTSATATTLRLDIQFWTSRGFAVFDVNYRGSTGYGRGYRQKLYGTWGLADVDDCIHGARYLARQGLVDSKRMAIRGGSAGGYTVLNALTCHDEFSAGSSFFGIGDLESMFETTHKFEACYDHWLIGPKESRKSIAEQRSPINSADRIKCPVIFFQGLDDKVVPPDQSESMVQALKDNKVPVAYLEFEGEGHGFRQSQNIRRSYEAELYFFGKVMGFEPADKLDAVEITHL